MHIHVTEYLADSAARFPEKTALRDKNGALTYAQLLHRARQVATGVAERLKGARRQPVFVAIGRNIDSIAAFLGVALSGNVYVPVDLSLPRPRLLDMAGVISPVLCITTPSCGQVPFEGLPVIAMEQAAEITVCQDLLEAAAASFLDTDPLYCIFTSGSTGVPKAVCVSHRSVIDMAEQFSRVFPLDGGSVFGNQAPFDFDVSVKDIYLTLKHGGTLCVLEKVLFSFPVRLISRLNEWRVNTLIWAVSALKVVAVLRTFEQILPEGLRLIMFSGEVMPPSLLSQWQSVCPGAVFVDLYGPTEITCNCTYHIITRPYAPEEAIPIGIPFPNTGILLLDGDRAVTAPNQVGELCVYGSCLALGYYHDPERTAAAFCQNPLSPCLPERIYRTGDLACYGTDGLLYFRGRADTQIKHMGHRIELAEIEAAALAGTDLSYLCCLFDQRKDTICLFYQSDTEREKELSLALRRVLPGYMIPTRYVRLDRMPANRTGKIDRVKLRSDYL